MDLLVTVIGNAVADPAFRDRLLDDPRGAIDEWGFQLTKGEARMLDAMFAKKTKDRSNKEFKETLTKIFDDLQGMLLEDMGKELMCSTRRCPAFGCYPPPSQKELRKTLDTLKSAA